MSKITVFTLGLGMVLAHAGLSQAANILGHPNPKSQVGRQGTKDNQVNRQLNGKANTHGAKKVTNSTATPPSKAWVTAGAKVFSASCASCHGLGGSGTLSAPRLAGPSGIWYTFHTEGRLANYIQVHMPGNNPGSLTRTQAKYVAAYVWSISKAK